MNPSGPLTRPLAASLIQRHNALKETASLKFNSGPQYRNKVVELLKNYSAVDYGVLSLDAAGSPYIVDVSYTQKTMTNFDSHQWTPGEKVPAYHIETNSMGMVLMGAQGAEVQAIEIPLAAVEFVEITGIVENGKQAHVQWTWRWATTKFYDELAATPGFSSLGTFDGLPKIESGVIQRTTLFPLYDDGWRLSSF